MAGNVWSTMTEWDLVSAPAFSSARHFFGAMVTAVGAALAKSPRTINPLPKFNTFANIIMAPWK